MTAALGRVLGLASSMTVARVHLAVARHGQTRAMAVTALMPRLVVSIDGQRVGALGIPRVDLTHRRGPAGERSRDLATRLAIWLRRYRVERTWLA